MACGLLIGFDMTVHAIVSRWISALLTAGSIGGQACAQSPWDIVLNGRSVHIDAAHPWNEANWGLGVEREFNGAGRWVEVAVANGFRDSAGHPSYMAGGGLKRRFRMLGDRAYVDVGVIGFVMTREDVRHDKPFPGVLPALTFGVQRVAVNVTYLPKAAIDRVTDAELIDPNMKGVLFVQLKLDASLVGFGSRRHTHELER
jgi:hypothetical protein